MTSWLRYARWCLVVGLVAALAGSACGGDEAVTSEPSDKEPSAVGSSDVDGNDSGSGDSGGLIENAPASGRATASVDGVDLTFDLPGALDCDISNESLTYSYRIGDNEVTLGAGVNRVDGGWMGSISMTIANPNGEPGPVAYYTAPGDDGILDESLFTVEGSTAKYSGPMLKQPANDGSLPPPIEVGTGTLVATC